MFGTVSCEIEVNAPASLVWQVYGTLELAAVVEKGLNDVIDKIEVIEGDGFAGTVLHLFFKPGVFPFDSCKEKFTVVDNVKMIKETTAVEGGYLEMGFDRYLVRFEVVEKDEKSSCITKTTIEYDLKEESAANASFVSIQTFMVIMNLAADHIIAMIN